MREVIGKWRDAGVTGRVFAAVLVSSARDTIWPAYVWLRGHWMALGLPPGYTWVASATYFSFWLWLFVLLIREGKRYRGMILDVLCGGSLLTVAAALHDPPVRSALSALGFVAAAWVTFLSASALVLARSVQRRDRQPQ